MAMTWKKRACIGLAGVVALALLLVLAGWLFLRASLPQLDGTRRMAALAHPVTIARDALGAPVVSGSNRLDVAWATGFLHGQERFFQMDLLRRVAAGELAELFGTRAVPSDRANRLHRFRARAEQAVARMTPGELAFLDRYVDGVNQGLNALGARPFEYGVITSSPRPWSRADSLLVVYAMFIELQGRQLPREISRGWLRDHTDPAQQAFLLPEATQWDAPLDANEPTTFVEAPIPPTAPLWWGRQRTELTRLSMGMPDLVGSNLVGSNNWAVAGSRSTTGAAIVEDDMHLGLQLPNIWYRMALHFPDGAGRPRRLVGVTLPGAPPMIIAGSNGDVAWGFTNSYADLLDLVALGHDGEHGTQVRTPAGWETPVLHAEHIRVKGEADVVLDVRETSLGPMREIGGVLYAVHWIAHDPAALNMRHWQMENAADVDGALAVAAGNGIPGQNLVAGDRSGNIGWTIAGMLPLRTGGDTSFPVTVGDTAATWQALLAPQDYPRIVNPANGQLATSNSRQLHGARAALLGDGGFDLGARQKQLHDNLLALGPQAGVRQVQAVALDDRALYVAPWRERALQVLDAQATAGHPRRTELRRLLVANWDGRASTASVAYRIARGFQASLYELLFDGANGEMAGLDAKAGMATATSRWPVVVTRLLDAQPPAWLPPGYADWRALQLAALDRVIQNMTNEGRSLPTATWGLRNTAAIAHPLAAALPFGQRFLAAPPDQLAGDADMPRVAGPKFGQSERMTISPGHEEQGLFNMPGGQSGHPLSPYFLAGHDDWVRGRALPLLPGPAQHTLTLQP
jgi:penicillin amidase